MALNEIIRGDTKKWTIALVDETGNPFNLSGCTVWFTAKPAISNVSDDSDAAFQHKIVIAVNGTTTSANGFAVGGKHPISGYTVSGAASGVLTHTISAAESTAFAVSSYVCDLQVKTSSGEIYTPLLGMVLTVTQDVTRSSS